MHLSTYYLNFQIIFLKVIVDHDGGKSADGAGSTAAYISKFSIPSAQVHNRKRGADGVRIDRRSHHGLLILVLIGVFSCASVPYCDVLSFLFVRVFYYQPGNSASVGSMSFVFGDASPGALPSTTRASCLMGDVNATRLGLDRRSKR